MTQVPTKLTGIGARFYSYLPCHVDCPHIDALAIRTQEERVRQEAMM